MEYMPPNRKHRSGKSRSRHFSPILIEETDDATPEYTWLLLSSGHTIGAEHGDFRHPTGE